MRPTSLPRTPWPVLAWALALLPAPAAGAADLLAKNPPASGVVVREDVNALGLASATGANGVRVHARSIANPDGAVSVSVVLAGGELRETDANRGIADAAAVAFSHPHSARLPAAAIREHFRGKHVTTSGEGAADALVLRIGTSQAQLEEALRLGHLLLTEGRLDEEAFRVWKSQAVARARTFDKDAAQQLEASTAAALAPEGEAARPPTAEQIDRLTLAAAQAWLETEVREAPLEVALAANLPRDDLLALGLKYFGSVPRRKLRDSQLTARRERVAAPGPREQAVTVADTGAGSGARVRVGWRVPAQIDGRGERVLQVAGRILRARLARDLQPGVDVAVVLPPGFPGRRWLGATLQVEPARAAEVARQARALVERLARQGPDAAELAAARTELQAEARAAELKAAHWASALEGFDNRGQKRADLGKTASEAARYSRKDVVDVLRRCVVDGNRVQIVVTPPT